MNKILELKGNFKHNPNPSSSGSVTLPKDAIANPITIEHLSKLSNQLKEIYKYWEKETLINGALVTVYYREIVAKSNRLDRLLREKGIEKNSNIRGAKFNEDNTKHIFTYFISLISLNESITDIDNAIFIVKNFYFGKVGKNEIDNLKENYECDEIMSRTTFANIIKDAYYVEDFSIDRDNEKIEETSIISIYKTGISSKELFRKIGINLIEDKMLDETTLRLTSDEFDLLKSKAPYLIAMKTIDLAKLKKDDILKNELSAQISIPNPQNEPTIGVIDTLFDENVYFSKWVKYVDMVDDNIPKSSEDYFHGTAISSLIVDGPSINPILDDGCGRFRVKHFGVACGGQFSSFTILKAIRKVVRENPEIKVWNLSLGSNKEINNNYISPEAAELDKIQSEYDIVFVIAGTNRPNEVLPPMKIGAPADSINSIVVNSVDFNNKPSRYHRVGPVLSFFYKPDLSYYGGDGANRIRVCSNIGECFVTGTSFAAPWIARKMAYLINVLGFNREVAKALLIDSAAGWCRKDAETCDIGYGVVPINIREIVETKNDEIRFIFTSATEEYETSTYNIPIPLNKDGKYPYITRATLCYYPKCSRNQGVDYTNTEIDFQFGRVQVNERGKVFLKSFNHNRQGEENDYTREINARNHWRKWDNVKHLANEVNANAKAKKGYSGELCGVKMTVKGRLTSVHETIPFGIVITVKEINGINRISDFIKRCELKGWFVNQVDIENRIHLKAQAEEEIQFE